MMNVTEDAKQELRRVLLLSTDNPEICLRLTANSPQELGLVLDTEAEGDQVIEHEGSKVLLIGQEAIDIVDRLTIGVEDTAEGKKLVALTG